MKNQSKQEMLDVVYEIKKHLSEMWERSRGQDRRDLEKIGSALIKLEELIERDAL
jgi:hypothetical protein